MSYTRVDIVIRREQAAKRRAEIATEFAINMGIAACAEWSDKYERAYAEFLEWEEVLRIIDYDGVDPTLAVLMR